ncbi:G-protein-signaling modulator 2 [Nymphon striatum]|nr:G-protein-signaling modulator 2 [Nymphon striatum]
MNSVSCMELALEGEKLCKRGDCRNGVEFFEKAIKAGTDDMKILSAIYSQLGNAYFYLGEYVKAMEYHTHDLSLARSMNDQLGEATASGNLGSTLKVIGKFDEATQLCQKHLDISRQLNDKIGESRALYNLANVYHTKGKHIGRLDHQEPGDFPEEVKICLLKAVDYYEQNLALMKELGERAAQGRACGNLGNTHYLLGDFKEAITYHIQRLKLAKEFGDKAAERRAHSNLGNAHIFSTQFDIAADHYKQALSIAKELGDKAVEAQACYSLGNTYTLLHDYATAIHYHLCHLKIAIELRDRVGESRACWSLSNAQSALGNHKEALAYANEHLNISREIGDPAGEATAEMALNDLNNALNISKFNNKLENENMVLSEGSEIESSKNDRSIRTAKAWNAIKKMDIICKSDMPNNLKRGFFRATIEAIIMYGATTWTLTKQLQTKLDGKNNIRLRRISMEKMNILKLTPDVKINKLPAQLEDVDGGNHHTANSAAIQISGLCNSQPAQNIETLSMSQNSGCGSESDRSMDEDSFFELVTRFQSKRMDDQRCSLTILDNKENEPAYSTTGRSTLGNKNGSVSCPNVPTIGSASRHHETVLIAMVSMLLEGPNVLKQTAHPYMGANSSRSTEHNQRLKEELMDLIAGMQSKRMDEQRASLPGLPGLNNNPPAPTPPPMLQRLSEESVAELPDENFFDMLMRCQSSRLEDQRSKMPHEIQPQDKPQSNHHSRPPLTSTASVGGGAVGGIPMSGNGMVSSTMPDEDFFTLIMRLQSGRLEDQRSVMPSSTETNSSSSKSSSIKSNRSSKNKRQ